MEVEEDEEEVRAVGSGVVVVSGGSGGDREGASSVNNIAQLGVAGRSNARGRGVQTASTPTDLQVLALMEPLVGTFPSQDLHECELRKGLVKRARKRN